ncbi:ABC transporter ATP-binding protein [uncultured Enterococcus sp.]|uniref:ABC transporter ATP-binding protein n=1 Tax=uncultured Enterococcus sp. TaxID=167972 RepID=UPI002597B0DB|nr:ABC transporter ATP-binding protein [uncultured Enterococcus sp.]
MENILEVQNVQKKIGSKIIIDEVSFHVPKGKIVGLLGPNGAGKTTLIRMIVGLMRLSQGEIIIANHSLKKTYRQAIAEVGAIVENPEFYNYMSGMDNLMQYARMSKKKVMPEEILAIIKQVHLEDHIGKKVKTYSLGMRQRLGVAQALIHQPSLLVLDEPMNGLDPMGMKEFREMIRDLKNKGLSVILSSHQLSDIELVADELVIVQNGKVTHQVSMNELKNQQLTMIIESQKTEEVIRFLRQEGVAVEQHSKQIWVTLEQDIRVSLLKDLVENDLAISAYYPKVASLEEVFLDWTKEGGL